MAGVGGFRTGVSTTQFHTRTYTVGTIFIEIVDMGTEILSSSYRIVRQKRLLVPPHWRKEAFIQVLASYKQVLN